MLFQLGYILEVIKTGKCPPFPLPGCMRVTWFLTSAQFLGQGAWEGVVEEGAMEILPWGKKPSLDQASDSDLRTQSRGNVRDVHPADNSRMKIQEKDKKTAPEVHSRFQKHQRRCSRQERSCLHTQWRGGLLETQTETLRMSSSWSLKARISATNLMKEEIREVEDKTFEMSVPDINEEKERMQRKWECVEKPLKDGVFGSLVDPV